MVQPENDVAVVVKAGPGDGDRLVCVLGKDCERASGIESHAPNGARVDIVLIEDTLD